MVCQREDAAHLHQFILHAAQDIVQDLAWTTSAMWVLFHLYILMDLRRKIEIGVGGIALYYISWY